MRILLSIIICALSLSANAQYAFELEVDFSTRIGLTDNYSVSGNLRKGKIESGKKYYLTTGAEFKVVNLMSAKTVTSVKKVIAPEKVSLGLKCKNFTPKQKVVLYGIATQPSYGGGTVKTYKDRMPDGMLKVKVNGMLLKAKQISKPIKTKSGDVLDMFYKTKSGHVFWLQIGNLSKIENLPMRVPCDSTLIGTEKPYAKIAFMPDGFQPTDLPNNYKGYEDKMGKASILVTSLKKFTFQAAIEFGGRIPANWRLKAENPTAQPVKLTEGRVDKITYDEH